MTATYRDFLDSEIAALFVAQAAELCDSELKGVAFEDQADMLTKQAIANWGGGMQGAQHAMFQLAVFACRQTVNEDKVRCEYDRLVSLLATIAEECEKGLVVHSVEFSEHKHGEDDDDSDEGAR